MKEIKYLAQSHNAGKWHSQDLNRAYLAPLTMPSPPHYCIDEASGDSERLSDLFEVTELAIEAVLILGAWQPNLPLIAFYRGEGCGICTHRLHPSPIRPSPGVR